MNSLRKLRMKKVKDVVTTKEDVKKVQSSLEKKTTTAFEKFEMSRKKVHELAHQKYLD